MIVNDLRGGPRKCLIVNDLRGPSCGSRNRAKVALARNNEPQHLIEGDQLAGELAGTSNQETVVLPRDRDVSVGAVVPVIREHKAEFDGENVHLFVVHRKTVNPNAQSVNPAKRFF
mgnify:CR=1 FL=1